LEGLKEKASGDSKNREIMDRQASNPPLKMEAFSFKKKKVPV